MMREYITVLGISILIAIGIVFLIMYLVVAAMSGKFEYVDFDGNHGNASMCYSSSGRFVCKNEAGEMVMVRSYREVEE